MERMLAKEDTEEQEKKAESELQILSWSLSGQESI